MVGILLAGWLLSAPQSSIEPTVAPLGRLLPELGKRFSLDLQAGANVRDDVVGIASPPISPEHLRRLLAQATNGTWEKTKTGWTLSQTRAQQLQDEATDIAVRAKWIRDALAVTKIDEPFDAARADALAAYRYEFKSKTEHAPSDYAQLDTMNARSPLGRLSRRLVEAIGVDRFASFRQGARIVLSTRPTPMQQPLGIRDLPKFVEQFRAEQNLYAEATKAKGQPQTGENTTFVSGFDYVAPIPGAWDKVLVVVETLNPFQTFAYVKLVDKDGKYVATARCYMNRRGSTDVPKGEANTPIIPLDAETIATLKAINKNSAEMTDAERKPFIDPAALDPLAFVHREALGAWSDFKKKPVIALLSDMQLAGYGIKDPFPLGRYQAQSSGLTTVTETEDGIVIRPQEPGSAKACRASRRALSDYIGSFKKMGYATLDSQVKLARTMTSRYGSRIGSFLRFALPGRQPDTSDMGLLRLIALGPPSQQEAMLAGAGLGLLDMTPEQRSWAAEILFNADRMTRPMEAGPGRTGSEQTTASEITEAFPNGLPASVTLTTVSTDEEHVRCKPMSGYVTQTMNSDTLAEWLLRPNESTPKEFQFGRVRSLHTVLKLSTQELTAEYREERIDLDSPFKPLGEMPESFRQRVEAQLKRLREIYKIPPP